MRITNEIIQAMQVSRVKTREIWMGWESYRTLKSDVASSSGADVDVAKIANVPVIVDSRIEGWVLR